MFFFLLPGRRHKKTLQVDTYLHVGFIVILTLTHRHDLVRGHETDSNRCLTISMLFETRLVLDYDSYVPSKIDLGAAAKTKRPTSCVLITPPKETKDKVWDPSTKTLFGELKEVCAQEMSQVPT